MVFTIPMIASIAVVILVVIFQFTKFVQNRIRINLFSKIFDQMPRALYKPDPFVFFDKKYNFTKEYGYFNDKLNNIREAILEATDNNDYLRERFAVEGDKGFPYKVAGATDEHRALIRKEFGLK